jgi:hypothetical protein
MRSANASIATAEAASRREAAHLLDEARGNQKPSRDLMREQGNAAAEAAMLRKTSLRRGKTLASTEAHWPG